MEGAKQTGKRQATPFARKERVAQPKRPGRKKGKGQFASRRRPTPEEVTETKKKPLACCPERDGELTQRKEHEQFVVGIPPVEPVVTRYVTESGYCMTCQKRVRSRHPEQVSDATGAAGVVIGPRAKALAADMKHRFGVSYGADYLSLEKHPYSGLPYPATASLGYPALAGPAPACSYLTLNKYILRKVPEC